MKPLRFTPNFRDKIKQNPFSYIRKRLEKKTRNIYNYSSCPSLKINKVYSSGGWGSIAAAAAAAVPAIGLPDLHVIAVEEMFAKKVLLSPPPLIASPLCQPIRFGWSSLPFFFYCLFRFKFNIYHFLERVGMGSKTAHLHGCSFELRTGAPKC